MAKEKADNTATLGFEARLWHAADLMRALSPGCFLHITNITLPCRLVRSLEVGFSVM